MPHVIDLTGRIFNRLTVLKLGASTKDNRRRWICLCSCGNESLVLTNNLKTGHSRSCGCLQKEITKKRLTVHGLRKSPEYLAWVNMRSRCYKHGDISYHNYGGRGIEVCLEWVNSFSAFISDMGLKPSKAHSLDRVNNDGNYEPTNCRWGTKLEQVHNRRMSRNNTSGTTGVYKIKNNKYRALIMFNRKSRHLGYFNTLEEAIEVRRKAEIDLR